jgi:hypothetical protein
MAAKKPTKPTTPKINGSFVKRTFVGMRISEGQSETDANTAFNRALGLGEIVEAGNCGILKDTKFYKYT